MQKDSVNICIAGEAGQGLDTVGQMLARALVRSGQQILVTQNYMSRIRGGHNFFSIRTGHTEEVGPADRVDLLAALNQESVDLHLPNLSQRGLVLYNAELGLDYKKSALAVPIKEMVRETILQNTVVLGCLAALLGLDKGIVQNLIQDTLGKKHPELLQKNLDALTKGYEWTREQDPDFTGLTQSKGAPDKMTVNGNQAIALGAMAAGVNFCSFYPMTPATSVALTLAANSQDLGIVVEQAEDEIAAINMAIGASFCGARSLVPTSGGGFALMGEGVSLSGMTETPVLIVLAQRPGPATGLPTRTEQGDLFLTLYSGHGEFPRAVFAPGDPEECFYLTYRGLDLAERFQSPVFVLTDQFLADSYRAVQPFDLSRLPEMKTADSSPEGPDKYRRYEITDSGLSGRVLPGTGRHLVVADSDEHTPDGHITEDLNVRKRMVDKRLAKGKGLYEYIRPPEVNGDKEPEILLLGWGSTKGAILEAASILADQGRKVASMHFSQVWPLDPEQFMDRLEAAGRVICIEGNATGQFAQLLRQQTGFSVSENILRYDGLPFSASYILQRV